MFVVQRYIPSIKNHAGVEIGRKWIDWSEGQPTEAGAYITLCDLQEQNEDYLLRVKCVSWQSDNIECYGSDDRIKRDMLRALDRQMCGWDSITA